MPWLPFSITVGRTSRAELLVLAGALLLCGAAILGGSRVRTRLWPAPPDPIPLTFPLTVSSTPRQSRRSLRKRPRPSTKPVRSANEPRFHASRRVEPRPRSATLKLTMFRPRVATDRGDLSRICHEVIMRAESGHLGPHAFSPFVIHLKKDPRH